MIVGIDLGTTNSVAAYMTADGPRLIPNALGEVLTPSVVAIDRGGTCWSAGRRRNCKFLSPIAVPLCSSVSWGPMISRTRRPAVRGPRSCRASFAIAQGRRGGLLGLPAERAVITVPAYFNDQQRKATINAGRIAGLEVERILNEPTAAAMAYGFHEVGEEKLLPVFDLGGGTFDVSLVELFEGVWKSGLRPAKAFLGGEDFTRTLASRVLETQGYPFERTELRAPRLVSRMIQQCEQAKCRLSRQDVDQRPHSEQKGEFHDGSPEVTITRHNSRAGRGTFWLAIELPIRRVLGDARVNRATINEVILVGGATRMPARHRPRHAICSASRRTAG